MNKMIKNPSNKLVKLELETKSLAARPIKWLLITVSTHSTGNLHCKYYSEIEKNSRIISSLLYIWRDKWKDQQKEVLIVRRINFCLI